MALPWLIGALVVGAIAAVVGDDDSSNSSSSNSRNDDEARRRRDAAEEKRLKEQRDVRRADARAEFKQKGDAIGRNLIGAVEDWVEVSSTDDKPFKASLTSSGYKIRPCDSPAKPVENLLRRALAANDKLGLTVQNLDFFGSVYDVRLQVAVNLTRKVDELNALARQQEELTELKREIRQFESEASLRIAEHL